MEGLRLLAAEVRAMNLLIASREMFGKAYPSLTAAQKKSVDDTVQGVVASAMPAVSIPDEEPVFFSYGPAKW